MANLPQVVLAFSGASVTSSGTLTSASFPIRGATHASLHYVLASATTGVYVVGTARFLFAADARETFLSAVNTGRTIEHQFLLIDSNNRYVSMTPAPNVLPPASLMQVQLLSSTNNTLTFDAVYVVLDQ